MSRREALAALARRYPDDYQLILRSIKAGTPIDEVTVAEWGTQWLRMRQRQVRPGTLCADSSAVNRWIIPTIGDKPLAGLQPGDVRAVHQAAEDAGLADSTAQRVHVVLKLLLRDASEEGHDVPERALRTRKLGGIGRPQRQALTVEQARKILRVATARPDASRWVAALLQGTRPAEALALRWSALDLARGTMAIEWQLKALPYAEPRHPKSGFRVPKGFESRRLEGAYHLVRPKTSAGIRVVPLVGWLQTELASWSAIAPKSAHDLVWPTPAGGPRNQEADRSEWRAIAEEAGVWFDLPGGRRLPLLYEARHTAATLLMASGTDEATLTSIVGHSKITSTRAYLHADETRKRAALEAVGAQLGIE